MPRLRSKDRAEAFRRLETVRQAVRLAVARNPDAGLVEETLVRVEDLRIWAGDLNFAFEVLRDPRACT